MEQIVTLIVEKTGLSEENAQQAADVVLGYIREQLPDSVAGMLDSVIDGGEMPTSMGDVVSGALGGLFGGGEEE